MNIRKPLLALIATAILGTSGAALAGPPVTVTFKHVGASSAAAATYTIVSTNETLTYASALQKPESTVKAKGSDTYVVQNTLSDDINFAAVRYKIGSKTCQFYTAYVQTLVSAATNTYTPTWSKSTTSSSSATCKATITSTNASTGAWAVEFTMK